MQKQKSSQFSKFKISKLSLIKKLLNFSQFLQNKAPKSKLMNKKNLLVLNHSILQKVLFAIKPKLMIFQINYWTLTTQEIVQNLLNSPQESRFRRRDKNFFLRFKNNLASFSNIKIATMKILIKQIIKVYFKRDLLLSQLMKISVLSKQEKNCKNKVKILKNLKRQPLETKQQLQFQTGNFLLLSILKSQLRTHRIQSSQSLKSIQSILTTFLPKID